MHSAIAFVHTEGGSAALMHMPGCVIESARMAGILNLAAELAPPLLFVKQQAPSTGMRHLGWLSGCRIIWVCFRFGWRGQSINKAYVVLCSAGHV